MGEKWNAEPRKVVKSPPSQFNFGGEFRESSYQKETFRFIGKDNVPYTRYGRSNGAYNYERKIEVLKEWKAEPLK